MSNRFVKKNSRVYIEGYDMSGYTRNWGSLVQEFAAVGEDAMLDEAVKGVLPGQAALSVGPISSVMDNTTAGMHATFNGSGTRLVTVALGFDGVPAPGDPVFAAEFEQLGYKGDVGEDVPVTLNFAPSAAAATLLYDNVWGVLLHESSAETAANDQAADHDHGASTALGGYMAYHLLSSDGTCTLKVQDADANLDGSFSDLTSSGEIDASVTPVAAIVALGKTATVERYIRWQIALGTATTATFVISFHRAIR